MSGRKTETLPASYFDGLYAENPDPWGFSSRAYEQAKYDHTLAALGPRRASHALEVGCSIGVLTERLAPVCDKLLATDLAPAALAQARARCTGMTHVSFLQPARPTDVPQGAFDLVVLSEVLYYFTGADLQRFAAGVRGACAPKARILAVHWLGETDYPLSGDEAVARFAAAVPDLQVQTAARERDYRLDLWVRS